MGNLTRINTGSIWKEMFNNHTEVLAIVCSTWDLNIYTFNNNVNQNV